MEQVLVVFGITFFVMISPGPDMLIVTRNTLISGRSAGSGCRSQMRSAWKVPSARRTKQAS